MTLSFRRDLRMEGKKRGRKWKIAVARASKIDTARRVQMGRAKMYKIWLGLRLHMAVLVSLSPETAVNVSVHLPLAGKSILRGFGDFGSSKNWCQRTVWLKRLHVSKVVIDNV